MKFIVWWGCTLKAWAEILFVVYTSVNLRLKHRSALREAQIELYRFPHTEYYRKRVSQSVWGNRPFLKKPFRYNDYLRKHKEAKDFDLNIGPWTLPFRAISLFILKIEG
jgi:hypothetical protein